ncbi:hypothetical protein DFA_10313 [Cavenderia fasciculata]|uniref:Pre-rRNA-processing protein TSR2 homolog n=1 Tax=Cavenderia fasciculata TaxID=261658 RepID=F4Q9V5_CACFS|nr:uncharacterized protein DFA_10313 [Cavenderia fasciculata]EGG15474.1 hypothetical protein DFA_10313 [Cavenderia fasciculata]|eukprot:XP_004354216.1 hypothetical protein DFA_10313 [Cavenderia fasciculata]
MEGQQQPIQHQPTNEEIWTIFDEAVARIFKQWTALQLAVENQWGGFGSSSKAEEMRQDVLDLFLMGKPVHTDMIAPILEDCLSQELNTVAEDQSCGEVAELVVQAFNLCVRGQFAQVVQLIGPEMGSAVDRCIKPMNDDDSDEDIDGDGDDSMMEDDSDMTENNNDNNNDNNNRKKNEPDEDGWVTVGRRR